MGHYVGYQFKRLWSRSWESKSLGDDLWRQKIQDVRRRWSEYEEAGHKWTRMEKRMDSKDAWWGCNFQCVGYNIGYLNAALGHLKYNPEDFKDIGHGETRQGYKQHANNDDEEDGTQSE
jgi:hypothetical protein